MGTTRHPSTGWTGCGFLATIVVTNGGRQPFGSRSAQVTITERKRRRLAPEESFTKGVALRCLRSICCSPRV